jgi:hypothetical protein
VQRIEDYGLRGARQVGPSEAEQRALADAMLRRTLDGIAKRNAERQAKSTQAVKVPTVRVTRGARKLPQLGAWERRGGATSWDWW